MSAKLIAESLKQQNKDAIMALQGGDYAMAYKIFADSLELEVRYELYDHAAKTRINMANTLYVMKKYQEALTCLQGALDYFEEKQDTKTINENRILEGYIYLAMGDMDGLRTVSDKMLAQSKEERIRAMAYIFGVEAMKKSDSKGKVIDVINKGISAAERTKDAKILSLALRQRIEYYEASGKSIYATVDKERLKELSQ